jgi:hypothetical protein
MMNHLKHQRKETCKLKKSQKREQRKKTRNNSDSDMQNEKRFKNSRGETHTDSDDSSNIIVELIRGHKPPATKEETGHILSDSNVYSDVSAGSKKRQSAGKKEYHGSDSDRDIDSLTKDNRAPSTRVYNALKDTKAKHSAEDITYSSDSDEEWRIETKKSLHSMSSSESEDSSAGTKTKKKEPIKKASNNKKGHKPSDSSSGSSMFDAEMSKKDNKKGKKDES